MPNYISRIKELREKRGLTQKELAKALNVTQTAITYWETGKREPNAEIIEKIADYFGVTPAYVMGWDNPKGEKYYLNEETARLAQEMFEDKDMRSLFHMKRTMPPERFKAHMEFMENLYQQEKEIYNKRVTPDYNQAQYEMTQKLISESVFSQEHDKLTKPPQD